VKAVAYDRDVHCKAGVAVPDLDALPGHHDGPSAASNAAINPAADIVNHYYPRPESTGRSDEHVRPARWR